MKEQRCQEVKRARQMRHLLLDRPLVYYLLFYRFKIFYDTSEEISMAMKTLVHRGYHGTIKVNNHDFSLLGEILFIEPTYTYKGETFEELEKEFQIVVEMHLHKCKESGTNPPFSE